MLNLDYVPHARSASVSSSSEHSLSRPHSAHGQRTCHPDLNGPLRPPHARVRASPYLRDPDSVHSSSDDTDDIAMYLAPVYPNAAHAASAFGRMAISPDHALDKLAANVRLATTTSASDRAKQIFVQAWCVPPLLAFFFFLLFSCPSPGSPQITPPTQTEMSQGRASISPIVVSVTTTTSPTSTPLPSARPSVSVSQPSRPAVSASEATVNITASISILSSSPPPLIHPPDCGIRPATTTEAEFLQDYIQKSNNSAGQSSINAARLANEQADASHRANDDASADGDDDDDDSEGNHSTTASKRNSLLLSNDLKAVVYSDDLSDKTPTAATLLAQAQAQRPGTYPAQASIRRHPAHEPILTPVHTTHPLSSTSTYITGQPVLSVRQFPGFPSIVEAVGVNSTSTHGMAGREVWDWFQDHLDALLESIRTFRFDQFEIHLRTFWSNLIGHHREVVHAPAIAGLMAKADAIVYDVGGLVGWSAVSFLGKLMLFPGNSRNSPLSDALPNSSQFIE